jgi:hypothetical protein
MVFDVSRRVVTAFDSVPQGHDGDVVGLARAIQLVEAADHSPVEPLDTAFPRVNAEG